MSAEDLFLIHGWGANAGCWQKMSASWRRRYRLTTVELPGHGQNVGGDHSLTDPEALVDHWLTIAPPRAAWLGWSLGGLLAQMAASRAPERVGKIVSLCMGARFTRRTDWPFGVAPAAIRKMRTALRENPARCLQSFIRRQIAGDPNGEEVLPTLQAMIETPFQIEELDAGLKLLETLDLRAAISRFSSPIFFIAGGRDTISNKNGLKASAELPPNGEYLAITVAGHAPLLSQPYLLRLLIDDFLQFA